MVFRLDYCSYHSLEVSGGRPYSGFHLIRVGHIQDSTLPPITSGMSCIGSYSRKQIICQISALDACVLVTDVTGVLLLHPQCPAPWFFPSALKGGLSFWAYMMQRPVSSVADPATWKRLEWAHCGTVLNAVYSNLKTALFILRSRALLQSGYS